MIRASQRTAAAVLIAAASVVCGASSASAAQILFEPFDYTAGQPIEGQVNPSSGNTWEAPGTAGPGTEVHSIASPGLTSPAGFPAASGNMADMTNQDTGEFNRILLPGAFTNTTPNYAAGSTLYYSLLLNVPDIAGLNTPNTNLNANNDMIIAFNNAAGTARPSNWAGELVIRLGSTASTYNLGIRASSTTAGTTYWTGDLNPGDTQLVVVRYQQGGDAASGLDDTNDLWINPAPATFGLDELSRPAPDGSSNGTINAANPSLNYAAALIIGAGISNTATIQNPDHTYLDEIRVGHTWLDVTTIPEPATLGLLGLGALTLLRRRRA